MFTPIGAANTECANSLSESALIATSVMQCESRCKSRGGTGYVCLNLNFRQNFPSWFTHDFRSTDKKFKLCLNQMHKIILTGSNIRFITWFSRPWNLEFSQILKSIRKLCGLEVPGRAKHLKFLDFQAKKLWHLLSGAGDKINMSRSAKSCTSMTHNRVK